MKKFRLLAAMVITVAMLFTVALAADVTFDAIEYNGTDDTVTVTVRAAKELNVGWFSCLGVAYDMDVFEYVSATSDDAKAGYVEAATGIVYSADGGDVTFAANDVIIAATFNVKDKAAVVGQVFAVDENETAFSDTSFADFDVLGVSTTVTGGVQAEAPTYTGTVNPKATLNGIDDVYTGVWAANYTVALNGNDITKVGLRFADKADDAFAVAKAADGEGSVAFKIAIVGAPADAVATPIVYTTEWIAAEAE